MSAPARPVTFAPGQLRTGSGQVYRGFSLRDTSGTGSVVRLWDSTSAAGQVLAEIQLPNSTDDNLLDQVGVWCSTGIFAEVVSGAVEGVVYYG